MANDTVFSEQTVVRKRGLENLDAAIEELTRPPIPYGDFINQLKIIMYNPYFVQDPQANQGLIQGIDRILSNTELQQEAKYTAICNFSSEITKSNQKPGIFEQRFSEPIIAFSHAINTFSKDSNSLQDFIAVYLNPNINQPAKS